MPSRGGLFSTLITSTVGRAAGQVSTYNLPVQAGTTALHIDFYTADASPDNKYTFYLIDPTGAVAAMDTSPKTVNGQSVATAELSAANPAARHVGDRRDAQPDDQRQGIHPDRVRVRARHALTRRNAGRLRSFNGRSQPCYTESSIS